MIDIKIDKNGKELGSRPVKCESRLRELEQLLRTQDSPMEFMCQSLGFSTVSDTSSLDMYLLQTFQKNVPPSFHLLSGPSTKKCGFTSRKESSKYSNNYMYISFWNPVDILIFGFKNQNLKFPVWTFPFYCALIANL